MLRSFFIYLSKASWARKIVTKWSVAWMMASRFVAGETLSDAIKTIQDLNAKGINATLDHLGENTTTVDESRRAVQDILDALDAIDQSGVRANVSIKLTQIGLSIDRALCAQNLEKIISHARSLENFIRIDMEDSPVTQVTLDMLFEVLAKGYKNVGIVIQSYLYRSADDVSRLMDAGIAVRLCKGAYNEPSQVAFPSKKDVDNAYDQITELLFQGSQKNGLPKLSADGKFPPIPALATHDEKRIIYAENLVAAQQFPKEAIEFQMLNGIRRDLQESLTQKGYPVRIYVPYGTEWYPYFMRRLAERPANVWFFISNFFRR